MSETSFSCMILSIISWSSDTGLTVPKPHMLAHVFQLLTVIHPSVDTARSKNHLYEIQYNLPNNYNYLHFGSVL